MMTVHRVLLSLTAASLLVAGCASSDPGSTTSPQNTASATSASASASAATAADQADLRGTVVFAAASLHAAYEKIAADAGVSFSFDGSSGLVDQLAGGAPADVFASADKRNMDKAVDQGLIDGEPTMFATNYLVLATPADNAAGVKGLDESLDKAKLVVCAEEVPCGGATKRLAEAVGVQLSPVSEESNVTSVLSKVTSGEADAGLVYLTDATGAGDAVQIIKIPEAEADPNTYWIAPVKGGDAAKAQAFIDLVMGDGQAVLADYGFGTPTN